MTKILFVCHGNICRSPGAELLLREMANRAGLLSSFEISSAATSSEEIGNPIYPPMRAVLEERGLDCSRHRARRVRRSDYDAYDLIIGMDEEMESCITSTSMPVSAIWILQIPGIRVTFPVVWKKWSGPVMGFLRH